jgi:1-phosphatidylinositol phosphodiesterase
MSDPLNGENWMSKVDGSKSLYDMSIPGTHATCALYGGDAAQTQKKTLKAQLNDGIRFVDIRCRQIEDTFAIHHDLVYEKINFGDGVLKVCLEFLADHPKEAIIMSVKPEYTPVNNKLTFEQVFDKYIKDYQCKNQWYFDDTVPTLDDVRGKIVLFRRFDTDDPNQVKGLKAQPWPDDTTFNIDNAAKMRIQDEWQVSSLMARTEKWKKIEGLLNEACTSNKQILYVDFCSGASAWCYPYSAADYINSRLTDYFLKHKQGRFGIIPMDFESTDRNILIAHTNVPCEDN